MIKSYFTIAFRNLSRNKLYAGINIMGLAIGMAVAILIGLWIWDELSFNSHFENYKQVAQVRINQTSKGDTYSGTSVAMPLAEALRTEHGDDFKHVALSSWNEDHLLVTGEKKLSGKGMWVQADFPEMFRFKMLKGSAAALKNPDAVLVSKTLAQALFGDADPLNKLIKFDGKFDLKIAGVYEDLPFNTSFYDVRILLPWENQQNWRRNSTDWDNHNGQLFVELADNVNMNSVSEKIRTVPTPHIERWKEEAMLQGMDKVHLYNEFENGKMAGGRIQYVWLFGIIGSFVLLLACINFMNLATARSEKRGKEVGIRKTLGSLRLQLIRQFLTESVLMASIALVLAVVLVQIPLPFFNSLSEKQMLIEWTNPYFWLLTLGFTVFTGIVAGSYPAFYLSSFQPIKVLKGVFSAGRFSVLPRKVLVVVQFTVSLALIIGTMVVLRQIQHAKNRPVGYSRDGLITVYMNTPNLQGKYKELRNELLSTGAVANMAQSSHTTTGFSNNNSYDWKGKDPGLVVFFKNVSVSSHFGETIGWQIKAGRDFSEKFQTDSQSVVLNEAAAKITGFTNPVGETITRDGNHYTIIGVANDMVTQSPYDPIDPAIFFMQGWLGVITIRINHTMPLREAIAKIEPVFKKHNPSSPFEYSFVDQEYGRKFANEEKIGNLATVFAVLAIFISCLGLFGLASFVAEQRVKEIGVRKVLGASVFSIWRLLSSDFVILVLVSLFVAVPVTYYSLDKWLQNYTYRTEISWWIFALAGIAALLLTLLTVSIQAIKAALNNPVKSLRTE
jgi:predicted permease